MLSPKRSSQKRVMFRHVFSRNVTRFMYFTKPSFGNIVSSTINCHRNWSYQKIFLICRVGRIYYNLWLIWQQVSGLMQKVKEAIENAGVSTFIRNLQTIQKFEFFVRNILRKNLSWIISSWGKWEIRRPNRRGQWSQGFRDLKEKSSSH